MTAFSEAQVYQRIGELAVSYQWIESRLREIGWFIQDPDRKVWPPPTLRSESSQELFRKVSRLFLDALPLCDLGPELEADFRGAWATATRLFDEVRRARNRILHSAFIELKASSHGEVAGIVRANPRLERDPETGQLLFEHEMLSDNSFDSEMRMIGELSLILNRCYMQLIARLPHEDDKPTEASPGSSA